MVIAILSWGSLIWKPQHLPLASDWKDGGPTLPLEFSRVSDNRKLTLVIDPEAGVACPTWFAFSPHDSLAAAIEDLRVREETDQAHIGYVDIQHQQTSLKIYPEQVDITGVVEQWCRDYNVAAAIWTALTPNFSQRLGVDFSIASATTYLKGLPESERSSALEYIHKTPVEVDTPLRRSIIQLYGGG